MELTTREMLGMIAALHHERIHDVMPYRSPFDRMQGLYAFWFIVVLCGASAFRDEFNWLGLVFLFAALSPIFVFGFYLARTCQGEELSRRIMRAQQDGMAVMVNRSGDLVVRPAGDSIPQAHSMWTWDYPGCGQTYGPWKSAVKSYRLTCELAQRAS